MKGINVVMKGPPWIPSIHGNTTCGGSECSTFTEADALHLKAKNMSVIRLGVIWAGGQPTQEPKLDPDFVIRLHEILELCHNHSIRVILDLHQDAMGTAMCGEGLPMWFSQKHFPHLIG